MGEICACDWFHGAVSKIEANQKLAKYEPGNFFVRLSSTIPGCFTISYVNEDKAIRHHRIDYDGIDTYSTTYKNKTLRYAGSLLGLITHLMNEMGLRKVVTGSTFQLFFGPKVVVASDGYRDLNYSQLFVDE